MKLLFSDSIRNVLAYTYAGLHETAANPCWNWQEERQLADSCYQLVGRGILQRFRLEELTANGANDQWWGSTLGRTEKCFLQQHGRISEKVPLSSSSVSFILLHCCCGRQVYIKIFLYRSYSRNTPVKLVFFTEMDFLASYASLFSTSFIIMPQKLWHLAQVWKKVHVQ